MANTNQKCDIGTCHRKASHHKWNRHMCCIHFHLKAGKYLPEPKLWDMFHIGVPGRHRDCYTFHRSVDRELDDGTLDRYIETQISEPLKD